jgi:N-carbamoyl-L-amino-acid hydrolase
MPAAPNLVINPTRLWDTLMQTAQFGATPKGGIRRLAASEEDRRVRNWFKNACEALGCTVQIDRCGNMFATRPGRRNDLLPIALGSHLDTQPTGGKFDGVLGVLAALEALRTLIDMGYETNAPVMIVNWTNEEGARFAPAMLGSGAYAGIFSEEAALAAQDREGTTLQTALSSIGYIGPEPAATQRFGALFELHIEQGPILEAENTTIGVVTGVQGITWLEVTLGGQEAHTGATPMHLRRNALLGAARMIEAINSVGLAHTPGVASVGLLENRPNSRNVVPGEVFFTIDLRHPDQASLTQMEQACQSALSDIAASMNLDLDMHRAWHSPPVLFSPPMIDYVRIAAAQAGLPAREITSGAGHDAAYIARVVPATMIFVPCLNGVSHNEAESATPADCAAGAQVLLNALLACDRQFA